MKPLRRICSVGVLSLGMMSMTAGYSFATGGISFTDVDKTFWGYPSIQWAIDQRVIDGYPDGTFKPNQTVNEVEFLAMLIRASQPTDFSTGIDPGNWTTAYLQYADHMGWKTASPSESASLSRGTVARYLANATGKNYSVDDSIQYLLDLGLAEGKSEKSVSGFQEQDTITRAEAVTFIERFRQNYSKLTSSPITEQTYNRSEVLSSYTNTKYNFTLYLPKSWEGNYEVKDNFNSSDHTDTYDFIDKANQGYGGVVFTIFVWPKEKWNKEGELMAGIIPITKIAENGENVILISPPTDVEYNLQDDALKEEYIQMINDINNQKYSLSVKLTDNDVKEILNGLIPKAVDIYGIFNGTGYFKYDATKTIPDNEEYGLVTGENWKAAVDTENVKSIADLKKAVEGVFTTDTVQKLFYSRYLDMQNNPRPLYMDYEGQLYVDTQNGGHGWAEKFPIDTAKLKNQKDNAADIELDSIVYDDPYGTLFIKIVYENGKWLMASGLDDYETIIIPGLKNLNVTSLNIPLQPEWHLHYVNNNHSDMIDDNGLKISSISASKYEKDFDFRQVMPNHSSIIHEESFDIPIGKCDLFTLDVDNGSAASGLTGTHYEYDAVIQIENKVTYLMSFSLNDKLDETKQKFIDILKNTHLKDR